MTDLFSIVTPTARIGARLNWKRWKELSKPVKSVVDRRLYCTTRTKMHRIYLPAFPYEHGYIVKPSGRKAYSRRKELGTMGSSVLIGILITFLVIILVLWLVQRLPIEARIRQIVQIIVIIIGIISLLKYLAVF
ncbi:hypothetical protein PR017_14105 [Rhizobium tumorigenes]|uniref:Uncharacterized protein n=2 Tax=Rhizobium TaxID=379 RepID=A0AAF1KK69_9HYPH|nr:Thivi_2564 family membrane protein [Rhizobium tumorigenes]WFR97458.1 hypothetical protein PR017_14105 [Rhizobium tumorigenes]